jgi:predicted outer membrane lipoprotein
VLPPRVSPRCLASAFHVCCAFGVFLALTLAHMSNSLVRVSRRDGWDPLTGHLPEGLGARGEPGMAPLAGPSPGQPPVLAPAGTCPGAWAGRAPGPSGGRGPRLGRLGHSRSGWVAAGIFWGPPSPSPPGPWPWGGRGCCLGVRFLGPPCRPSSTPRPTSLPGAPPSGERGAAGDAWGGLR